MDWKPATIESVKRIVESDLANCTNEQAAAFKAYCLEPHSLRLSDTEIWKKLSSLPERQTKLFIGKTSRKALESPWSVLKATFLSMTAIKTV
jgi:hypothetical protein